MSEEEDKEIGVNIYADEDEDTDEESSPLEDSIEEGVAAQPVQIVREEIVTVAENPNAEEKVPMIGNTEEVDSEDDLYRVVKAHSVQLSRLTTTIESLQSQIKQLESTRLSGRKTGSAIRNSMKTKKNKATAKKPKKE